MERKYLHWADYLVFAISLVTSLTIGLYHGWKNRKKQSTESFLMADRSMGWLPVSLSLYVGWFSALSVLGDPTEAYYFGTAFLYVPLGHCLCLLTTLYFAPKYRDMKLTSAYEFLEIKYGKALRLMGSMIFSIANIIYLAIALYGPALGVSQMSGLNINLCIVGIGIVCMIYTSLGGMKAVLWVDVMQCFVMIAGLIVVLICGIMQVGGVSRVLDLANQSGRNTFNTFDPDPRLRASMFVYIVGGYFRAFKSYIGEQIYIQRYCITKSNRALIIVVLLQIPLIVFTMGLFACIGITMGAFFYGCDPLEQGNIEKKDQLLPFFVLKTTAFVPGLSGLFMAAFVSAALSTMSSQHNSLVTMILKDFILPCYKKYKGKALPDRRAMILSVVLALLVGTVNILTAIPVSSLQDIGVFGLTAMVSGAMKGPISALFALAVCCSFVDYPSALIAFFLGNGISIWLGTCSIIWTSKYHGGIKGQTDQCNSSVMNASFTSLITEDVYTYNRSASYTIDLIDNFPSSATEGFFYHINEKFIWSDMYKFSPIFYAAISILLTMFIGLMSGLISKIIRALLEPKRSGTIVKPARTESGYELVNGKSISSSDESPPSSIDVVDRHKGC